MGEFILVVAGLILLACVFVVFPLMMTRSNVQQNRRQINAAMFTSRLKELTQERDQGDLTEEEFERLKTELQRRVLEDVDDSEPSDGNVAVAPAMAHPWKALLLLALFIPLSAWLIYDRTGAKADWDITEVLKQVKAINAKGEDNSEITRRLAKMLTARLEQKPDDPHHLMLLANAQMSLQNYPAASGAYQRLATLIPDDPSVLAQYAQALYLTSDRQMTDKVKEVVDKTLAVAPNQPTVLGMLGIHHFEQRNFEQAIDYWERLLAALGPGASAPMIREGIKQAKELLGQNSEQPADEPLAQTTSNNTAAAGMPARLLIDVSIDQAMSAPDSAPVFVFARAVKGPKMPLAVARLTVADLPTSITLDDTMAMTPSLKLSSFDQVEVVARVSKKGIANRGPGDLEGIVGPVTISTQKEPLAVSINRLLP